MRALVEIGALCLVPYMIFSAFRDRGKVRVRARGGRGGRPWVLVLIVVCVLLVIYTRL